MDADVGFNKLYHLLHAYTPQNATVLGGSATPGFSLNELVSLSSDPDTTKAAFNFGDIRFNMGSPQGDLGLRETIANTYDRDASKLVAEDIIVANGTTGSNHIVHQSLLKPGDHIICQYPIYGPCIEEPQHIGCDISYLRLDPTNGWALGLEELKALIRPGKTKLLMLNNPVNPTGTHFATELQQGIVKLAKQYDFVIHSDEIFRPLFHTTTMPSSLIEHAEVDFDKVVVTSSLSKAYGLSGVRIGWIATRSKALRSKFKSYRIMSCPSVSLVDEAIAKEALSQRCRPGILKKHLTMSKQNLELIQAFVDRHKQQCEWVRPTAGAVGFVKFKDPSTGEAVDDVEFCNRLVASKKVLLAPATTCFEFGDLKDALRGRARIHFTTTTENLQKGLELLGEFLDEEKASTANGALTEPFQQLTVASQMPS